MLGLIMCVCLSCSLDFRLESRRQTSVKDFSKFDKHMKWLILENLHTEVLKFYWKCEKNYKSQRFKS